MRSFDGRVAAITGAASGIGRALAVELARRSCHLSLSDVDGPGLDDTVALAQGAGPVRVRSAILDVADADALPEWASQVVADHGGVHLVVNNAGMALTATVADMSDESLHRLMDVNFWGVVNGTRAFLPHLRNQGEGHIVNLSSVFGLLGIPSQSAYNAAKFGVRGFTEALRIELDVEGSGVSATCVHPGGIATNIVRNGRFEGVDEADRSEMVARFAQSAGTSPERAAQVILRAVERNRRRVLIGADARVFNALAHLPAGVHQRLLVAGARRRAGRR